MEMTGEYRIPASRDDVWRALSDPATLEACIPGCEELVRAGDDMTARIVAKIGPLQAAFLTQMHLSHLNRPEGGTLRLEADAGLAGFASGSADVRLREDGDATVLSYEASGEVRGKLAQLGPRLIDTTARKIADEFFAAFANRLAGDNPTMASPPLTTPTNPEPADDAALDELTDRIEHEIEDEAQDVGEVAEEIEEEVEVAAGRGFLGGSYVWGLLALIVVILFLAIVSR